MTTLTGCHEYLLSAGSIWAEDEHAEPEHNEGVQIHVGNISGSLPCELLKPLPFLLCLCSSLISSLVI